MAFFLAGCAAPIGVKRVGPEAVHRALTRSVLSSGELSGPTQIVLRRYDLVERFDDDPDVALAQLHAMVAGGGAGNDEVFALAELSFLHAQREELRPHYFAAAVYAYAFAFPENDEDRVDPIDPRLRVACDLYNRALTDAFKDDEGDRVVLRGGDIELPFGALHVDFDDDSLLWGERRLVDFVPVAELEIRGLRNRYRRAGVGMPLAARTVPVEEKASGKGMVGPRVRVPATAVLRIDAPRQQLAQKIVNAEIDLYTADESETVVLNGDAVPLELEPSAALAMTLAEAQFWRFELAGLLGSILPIERPTLLVAREPHRAGRIPVVFVHGTGSSVGRWADMVNDLDADPAIRRRFQLWFFTYDSGNPIAYSSLLLRRALTRAVDGFDPAGDDECMRRMIVIGHSQGGLLTKMTAIESGDRFWKNVSSKPFEEANLSPEARTLLGEALFVEPLPFVARVVFIATPHRGSYLAGPQIVRRLAARLIKLPADVVTAGVAAVGVGDATAAELSLQRLPTSIDNMAPGHPFIRALASLPVTPAVTANSIIPVKGDGPIESGNDGVVAYESAHIDGVESELVVRSPHSTQANPKTIEEVRRILRLHAELPCGVD